jgi:thiamine-phosphate pyrophosphorylase
MRGLYLVTPNWDDTDRLIDCTEQSLKAGAALVQYRHKTAGPEQRQEQAAALLALCRRYHRPLVINDFIELCVSLDADGVHLGGTDESVKQARAMVGKDKIIGASCYGDMELARAAHAAGASYVAFGGFYPSLVKKYPVTTNPDVVKQAKVEIPLPCVVIGGMTVENSAPLVARGADMVAAITSVYLAEDIGSATREFAGLF